MGFFNCFKLRAFNCGRNTEEKVLACPRCLTKMQKKTRMGVTIDKCISCGGIWLDKGEIFRIIEKMHVKSNGKRKK